MKKTGLTLIALALASTAACGGSGGSKGSSASNRPTQGQISKSLSTTDNTQAKALPKTQADCVAKLLVKSKLSDKTLKAVVTQDKTYKATAKENKILATVGKTINKNCAA